MLLRVKTPPKPFSKTNQKKKEKGRFEVSRDDTFSVHHTLRIPESLGPRNTLVLSPVRAPADNRKEEAFAKARAFCSGVRANVFRSIGHVDWNPQMDRSTIKVISYHIRSRSAHLGQ